MSGIALADDYYFCVRENNRECHAFTRAAWIYVILAFLATIALCGSFQVAERFAPYLQPYMGAVALIAVVANAAIWTIAPLQSIQSQTFLRLGNGMTKYLGWETATSLLLAYESMALAHRTTLRRVSADGKEPHAYFSYMHAFGLLILNASFVEGTVRSILTEKVKTDLNEAVERGIGAGRTEHDAPTRLLQKFLIELESSGGWDNLVKTAGVSYYGAALDAEVEKEVKEGIGVLFTLRNVLAHGTTLIQPTVKMTDDMKDIYPYSWQAKLHGVGMYLERHFKRGGMFENLADPDLPEHFINVTKKYFEQLAPKFSPLPERAQKTVDMISSFSFGFVNNTR